MKFNSATLGSILWPAFLGAAAGDGLLFTLVDPEHVEFFGAEIVNQRQAAYTLGFFVLWLLFIVISACSLWLYTDNLDKRAAAAARRKSKMHDEEDAQSPTHSTDVPF